MTSDPGATPPSGPSATPGEPAQPALVGPVAEETPRHLHPAAWLIEGVRVAQSAVLPLVIVAFGQGPLVALGGVAVLVAISCGLGVLVWKTTTYTTSNGKLVLRKGVINKREQEVPAARISALDTSRGVLQRILGVVELQVQTAGGGEKAELRLRAVSFAEAERIRGALGHALAGDAAPLPGPSTAPIELSKSVPPAATAAGAATAAPLSPGASAGPEEAASAEPDGALGAAAAPSFVRTDAESALAEEQVVYRIPGRDLIVAALTSPSLAIVGAAVAGVGSQLSDVLPESTTQDLGRQVEQLSVGGAIAILVLALLAASLVAVVGTVLAYAGFTVTRDARRIRIKRGLLTERFSTIPLDRIHGVRIVESPLRQLLGYASLEVEVAGYAGTTAEVTTTLVPIIPIAAARHTLAAIAPPLATAPADAAQAAPPLALRGVPARGRRRYVTTALGWAALPAVALAVAPIGVFRFAAPIPLVIAVVLGVTSARAAGWSLHARGGGEGQELVIVRWRSWARSTLIADRARLQRAEIRSSPTQRRLELATFRLALSNRREARVRHLEAETVHELAAIATAQPRG